MLSDKTASPASIRKRKAKRKANRQTRQLLHKTSSLKIKQMQILTTRTLTIQKKKLNLLLLMKQRLVKKGKPRQPKLKSKNLVSKEIDNIKIAITSETETAATTETASATRIVMKIEIKETETRIATTIDAIKTETAVITTATTTDKTTLFQRA